MHDIPGSERFVTIEPLNKGWSSDQKYTIETTDGARLLLRVADIAEHDRKRMEYAMQQRIAALGVPTSAPVDFGLCHGGCSVYQLLTWCDGEDAASLLPLISETRQYELGRKAGALLRRIHTLPAPQHAEPWGLRFRRKVQGRVDYYNEQPIQCADGDRIVGHLLDNQSLLDGRPQTFNHGDYNTTNLIVTPGGEVGVIDCNAYNGDHGDPWWELCAIAWGEEANPYFMTGLFQGYFDGTPPPEFFRMQAYYFAYDALAALCSTAQSDGGQPEDGQRHVANVLRWFGDMGSTVPTWYLQDLYTQYIDDVPLRLKAPFDLSFLGRYGRVFTVFDAQDSGNLCFGMQSGQDRLFIKFAGAPTMEYGGQPQDSVARLRATVPVYGDLAHPTLIHLRMAEDIGGGFAAVFDWTDGQCLGRMYPQSRAKFLQMPMETRMEVFEDILAFHAHVTARGYVAVDFYDGSILYDFQRHRTVICDIDFYVKRPYANPMGRLWGSSRFMSPEEFTLGASIDEVTNVYTMGATAFALFCDSDRTPQRWPLHPALYDVVRRAASDQRDQRQQTIRQLIQQWAQAKELSR